MTDKPIDTHRVKAAVLRERLLLLASELPPGGSLRPADVAVAIAGKDEKVWRRLMKPIRDEAVRLAKAGRVVILRKGEPVDPTRFKGLYRIRLLAPGEAQPVFERAPSLEDIFDDED